MKQAEDDLIAAIVDPGFAAMNLNLLDGPATPPSQAASAAMTMPFGPGGRLVLVRDCPYFSAGRFEGADEVDALAELAEKGLPPGCHLVFSVPRNLDRRLSQTKAMLAKALVREFPAAKPWDDRPTIEWLMGLARERHYRLSTDAAQTLVEALGSDRWKLEQELEKLATYAAGEPITVETVAILGAPGETDVFEVLNAIAERNPEVAIRRVRQILVTEAALKVLATMVTLMRGWLQVKLLAEKGMGADAIAKTLGQRSSFRVQEDLKRCRAWSVSQLQLALNLLLETDLSLKRGARQQEGLLLETLIVRLSV